jgi:hypothetical protein
MCLTKYPEIFQALSEPFPPEQIKTRAGGGGRQLRYITARHAMNRLDMVLGPENWWDEYRVVGDVLYCLLTIVLPGGESVTKWGAGGFKTMTEKTRDGSFEVDQENTDKTGESDALKRAAVKFGVGRDLYGDGIPDFMPTTPPPPEPQITTPQPKSPHQPTNFAWVQWVHEQAKSKGVEPKHLVNHLAKTFCEAGLSVDGKAAVLRGMHADQSQRVKLIADVAKWDPTASKPAATPPGPDWKAPIATATADSDPDMP